MTTCCLFQPQPAKFQTKLSIPQQNINTVVTPNYTRNSRLSLSSVPTKNIFTTIKTNPLLSRPYPLSPTVLPGCCNVPGTPLSPPPPILLSGTTWIDGSFRTSGRDPQNAMVVADSLLVVRVGVKAREIGLGLQNQN